MSLQYSFLRDKSIIKNTSIDVALPQDFKIYRSRFFAILVFFIFFLANSVVALLPLAFFIKVVISVIIFCAVFYFLYRDVWLLTPSSKVAIRLMGSDIALISRDGKELNGHVLRSSLVTPAMTILNVAYTGKMRIDSVVIFPDSMDAERFRELRVLLKWGSASVN